MSASQCARVLVGGDDALHSAAGQHGRDHARAGADVESQLARGQRRRGDQIEIFAPHRREHAVMRMDAIVRGGAQRGDLDSLAPPFESPDESQQFAQ